MKKRENFHGQGNATKRMPDFLEVMIYLGPNKVDVDLEWIVQLNEYHNHSRSCTPRGEMSEIIVQE